MHWATKSRPITQPELKAPVGPEYTANEEKSKARRAPPKDLKARDSSRDRGRSVRYYDPRRVLRMWSE